MWHDDFFSKVNCKYARNCWRCSYTAYLWDKKEYPGGVPPSRGDLFLAGYASSEMAEIKQVNGRSGKMVYGGIYAQGMPVSGGKNWCPGLSRDLLECTRCEEFKRQNGKEVRFEEKRAETAKKYFNATGRVHIPREVRVEVAQRDKYTCVYCGRHNVSLKKKGVKCNIDHVVPLALGGTNTADNMCFTCFDCNNAKGADIWEKKCRVGYYQE